MIGFRAGSIGFFILSLTSSTFASASQYVPPCMDNGRNIPISDSQVLNWKVTTPNTTLKRAHVRGTIIGADGPTTFKNGSGHIHFLIQIGNGQNDVLEVVYNSSFGPLPQLKNGTVVEACGDYITSTQPTGPYKASPAGAIIHWVHRNPRPYGHDSGFLMVGPVLCGGGSGDGAP